LPYAQQLVVCDRYAPAAAGKLDMTGCFHTIRPRSFPHVHDEFCVVAHLTGGLGEVTAFIDIRDAATSQLVYWSHPHRFHIPDRQTVVRPVNTLEGVPFSEPGIYFVELYCENTPIADFRLRVAEREVSPT
jgi:hypothetical protein